MAISALLNNGMVKFHKTWNSPVYIQDTTKSATLQAGPTTPNVWLRKGLQDRIVTAGG